MASCPNCGFDLTTAGKCPVCGYDAAQPAGTVSELAAGKTDESTREMVGVGALASGGRDEGSRSRARAARSLEAESPRQVSATRRLALIGAGVVGLALIAAAGFLLFGAKGGGASAAALAKGGSSLASDPVSAAVASPAQGTPSSGGETTPGSGPSFGAVGSSAGSAPGGVAAYSDPAVERTLAGKASDRPSDYTAIDLTPAPPIGTPPAYDITKRSDYPPLTSEKAYVAWMLAHYPGEQEKFLEERWARATLALERGHIRHERTLMGFLLTPREWFVRAANLNRSYENVAMPIGYGQTISGPDLVARMTDYLNVQPDQRVLEIGTGSGFQSAFLSELSNYVYTIEIVKPLAEETNAIYVAHTPQMPEYANIHRRIADGYYGWREFAPFDRIIVTCGIDHIPPDLIKELAPDGIMVIPVGPPSGQTILKITKHVAADGHITLTREDIYHGMAKDIFVPFTAVGGGVHSLNTDVKR